MNELPVGRRVAQWRLRRNMTQQQFADRLGKSKSWVDKVERGVRRLERVSNLREIAEALRIDLEVLLAEHPGQPDPAAAGLEGVRAALARYHVEAATLPPDVAELRARLDHAELTYRHARYPELLARLPGLLDATRAARAARPGRAADDALIDVYGLVALVLVKVDQGELAWLAADRGMAAAVATHDPWAVAVATVPLAQALRYGGRRQPAMQAAVVAAYRITPPRTVDAPSGDPSLRGTLLLQAALAAAGRGNESVARELLDRAEGVADEGFGRAAVEAARVVVESALGDVAAATARHERLTAGDEWRWLPPEHRAAYLVDAARTYAQTGDMLRAGRALLDAERTAHGEVHDRPPVRDLVAVVARSVAAPSGLVRLAATLHVT
ncbi:helix-turn-helix domain-containing protein [Micromonospora sp. NPDC001898]|uniref:helix-turn-helix domain-containing protein n=1 Tax=Micromonospora sp. NPDC001898 TaxID=3364221 RepID=UPI0036C53955